MVLDDGETELHLHRKVSSSCHRCGRKGRSWSYRSSCKTYNLHVACVREMLMGNWAQLYRSGSGRNAAAAPPPSLKNTLQSHHRRKPSGGGIFGSHRKKKGGKAKKCCEMAGLAVQCVISAVLGDPTALIAGLIGTLISRA